MFQVPWPITLTSSCAGPNSRCCLGMLRLLVSRRPSAVEPAFRLQPEDHHPLVATLVDNLLCRLRSTVEGMQGQALFVAHRVLHLNWPLSADVGKLSVVDADAGATGV